MIHILYMLLNSYEDVCTCTNVHRCAYILACNTQPLYHVIDFTFVCPTEIIAFSDAYQQFKDINCELIAASVDSEYSHLAWCQLSRKEGGLGKLNIPIVSDMTKSIARKYGVLIEEAGVALRGLFLIDDKGVIRNITINDLPVGRSVDETLRLVKAFQFTDKYGM